MTDTAKIISIVFLVLATLLYFRSFKVYSDEQSGNPKLSIYIASIFVLIAAVVDAFYKGGSGLQAHEVFDFIVVLLAVALSLLCVSRDWGLFALVLIVGITLLTSVQFVLK